jgi:hypothetical protein
MKLDKEKAQEQQSLMRNRLDKDLSNAKKMMMQFHIAETK